MKRILKNYKTTLPGVLIFVSLQLYWLNIITREQFEAGLGVFSVLGFLGAKDVTKNESN